MKLELYSWKPFYLKLFCYENSNFEFENLKIWIFQTTSDREITKINFVDLKKLWNFVVDNFLIWNHLVNKNYIWISQIWISNFVNDLGWRKYQNESCRSRKVMKLCSWQFFYLKSSCHGKIRLKFSNLKFKFYKWPRMNKLLK